MCVCVCTFYAEMNEKRASAQINRHQGSCHTKPLAVKVCATIRNKITVCSISFASAVNGNGKSVKTCVMCFK